MFNSDDLIEFIVLYANVKDSMYLYNESGTELTQFGNYDNATIITNGNITYLLVNNIEGGDSTVIYSLPGQMTTDISQTKVQTLNKLTAYPNPTANTINLLYNLKPGETTQMRIYNVNGVLIDTKTIDSNFDRIQLNVENYAPGIYFYEVNGQSSRFIVNK